MPKIVTHGFGKTLLITVLYKEQIHGNGYPLIYSTDLAIL